MTRINISHSTGNNNRLSAAEKNPIEISVVICTFNRCESLKGVLESLLEQEYDNSFEYEVIVADNNSKDRTKKVIESYKPLFNGRLHYLFEPTQGKPYALNKAIKEAQGEIIAFTDDDCLTDKKWLLQIKKSFNGSNPEVGMAGGIITPLWITENKPEWIRDSFMGPLGILDYGEREFLIDNDNKKLFYGNNFALKKNLFESLGDFNVKMTNSHDTEICLRFLKAGAKGLYNPDMKVAHKITPERATAKYFYKWFYRRGNFWDNLEYFGGNTKAKFYHPIGIPLWVFIGIAKEFGKSFFAPSQYHAIKHRCMVFFYLGKLIKRFKENIA